MKSRYIVLAAILSVALAACTPSGNQPEGGVAEYSLRLSGEGVDGTALEKIGALRVISSLWSYNKLAVKEGDNFKFTIPTRKQTLFFVANEKKDLSALTTSSFNQTALNTADYFSNNGQEDPKLYVAAKQIESHMSAGGLSSLEMRPAYAKLSFKIADNDAGRTIKSITIEHVPTQFMLGGAKTNYPSNAANYMKFTLAPTATGFCYLPEHDPADVNNRTTIKIITSDSKAFYTVIKEPYSSVDDGKIVRGRHYNMSITLPKA